MKHPKSFVIAIGVTSLLALDPSGYAQDPESGKPCRQLENIGEGVYRCGTWICQMKEGVSFPEEMKNKPWQEAMTFMQEHNLLQMEMVPTEGNLMATPNDPDFGNQSCLNGAQDCDIRNLDVWNTGTGSRDVKVCVIDSGIDLNHSDLKDNIDVASGADFVTDDGSPQDIHGHGTCMSGIVGAKGNNGQGIAGVNWDVSIVPLQATSPANGNLQSAAVIDAVNHCIAIGAEVINASFIFQNVNTAFRNGMKLAMQSAVDQGIFVAVASGNGGEDNKGDNDDEQPVLPCNLDPEIEGVLCVASIDANGALSSFSNFGNAVGVAAPGGVLSTALGGGTGRCGGTSSATAVVSGAAALLKSLRPDLTPAQIEVAIRGSVDARGLPIATGGSLNIRNAAANLGINIVNVTPEAQKEVASSGGSGGGCSLLTEPKSRKIH